MPEIFNSAAKTSSPPSGTAGKTTANDPQLQNRELEKMKKESPARIFSSFLPHPRRWTFETQETEEKIILILRRHWFTNLGWFLGVGIFFWVPPLIFMSFNLSFLPFRFQLVSWWIWYLLLGGFVLERFLDWFFNVFIITDERIVDFDFYGLIYKEISDAKIENIQDVTYKVSGFVPNLFDYGGVVIQTSAQIPQFEFEDVPQPARVARVLRELVTEEEVEKIEGRVR